MIVVLFQSKGKWKKKLDPKKLYTVKEASRMLAETEAYAEEHQLKGTVEYSILNDEELLFRDEYQLGMGQSTNFLFLVRNALHTTFKNEPENEKTRLLELLTESVKAGGEESISSPVLSGEKPAGRTGVDSSNLSLKKEANAHKQQKRREIKKQKEAKKAEKRILAERSARQKESIRNEKRRMAMLAQKKKLFEEQKAELLAREEHERQVIELEKATMNEKKQLMEKENLSEKQFQEELQKLERDHRATLAAAENRMNDIRDEKAQLEESPPLTATEASTPSGDAEIDFQHAKRMVIAWELSKRGFVTVGKACKEAYRFAKAFQQSRIEKRKLKEEARDQRLEGELELQQMKKDLLLEMKKEQLTEQERMGHEMKKKDKEMAAFNRRQERYKRELQKSSRTRRRSGKLLNVAVFLILIFAGIYMFRLYGGDHLLTEWIKGIANEQGI